MVLQIADGGWWPEKMKQTVQAFFLKTGSATISVNTCCFCILFWQQNLDRRGHIAISYSNAKNRRLRQK